MLEAFAENDPGALRTELIQVAAVAVKWAQALDRRDQPAAAAVTGEQVVRPARPAMNTQEIALTGAHGVRLAAIREGADPRGDRRVRPRVPVRQARARPVRPAAPAPLRGGRYSTLRFDFSGNGASGNAPITDERRTGDLRAVLDQVETWGYQRVALHGHSKGGSISLRARDPRVSAMVLTGARTAPVYYDWSRAPARRRPDGHPHPRPRTQPGPGPRAFHLLTQQSLDDFATIDTREILSAIKAARPADVRRRAARSRGAPARRARGLRDEIPLPESRLLIIHGADHSMEGHIEEVADHGIAWLRTYCPA